MFGKRAVASGFEAGGEPWRIENAMSDAPQTAEQLGATAKVTFGRVKTHCRYWIGKGVFYVETPNGRFHYLRTGDQPRGRPAKSNPETPAETRPPPKADGTGGVGLDGLAQIIEPDPGMNAPDMNRIKNLADRWYETAVAKPFRLPDSVSWIRAGGESDRYSQPGYVGPLFRPGGVLLLAMNPGGRGEKDTEHDERYFEALQDLRENSDHIAAFVEWNDVFARVAVTWKYYWNLMQPILTKVGIELPHVAYLNILKWRNKPEANSKRPALYDLSWESQTRDEVKLLDPGHIIVLGIGAGKWFARKYRGCARMHVIPRVRGDSFLSRRTSKAIDALPHLKIRR
jgi:hypothetical protein